MLTEGVEVRDLSPNRECAVAQLYSGPTERQLAWSNLPASDTASPQWRPVNASGPGELQPTFSPDGKWLAFCSHDDRDSQIYITSFPDLKLRFRVSRDGGFSPRWRQDGNELFHLSLDGYLVRTDTSGRKGRDGEMSRKKLFPTNTRLARNAGPFYDVSSDGQRFLVTESGSQMTEARIEILLNWPALMPDETLYTRVGIRPGFSGMFDIFVERIGTEKSRRVSRT